MKKGHIICKDRCIDVGTCPQPVHWLIKLNTTDEQESNTDRQKAKKRNRGPQGDAGRDQERQRKSRGRKERGQRLTKSREALTVVNGGKCIEATTNRQAHD